MTPQLIPNTNDQRNGCRSGVVQVGPWLETTPDVFRII